MLELIGQKDGHDVYECSVLKEVNLPEHLIHHYVMGYNSAGSSHIIQEATCCNRACRSCMRNLEYAGTTYKWLREDTFEKNVLKEKKSVFYNKDFPERKYTKEIMEKRAVELYGKGSTVVISDAQPPTSSDYVTVFCGKHKAIFKSNVENLGNARYISCPECKKERGIADHTKIDSSPEGRQKHVDTLFGEGEYKVFIKEGTKRDQRIEVFHKGCGMNYYTTLELLYQNRGCGYCASGKVYYQHHLDDKIKKSGAHVTVKIEDYFRRDGEDKFNASCNQCHKTIKMNTSQLSRGKVQCPHCEQQKKLSEIPDGWIWCVNTKIYKCVEHNHFYEGNLSTLKCKYCSGASVDTDTMRYILTKKFGDRYDYSKAEYLGKECKIDVRCKKHDHIFTPEYHGHSKGKSNCPICNDEERGWGRDGFYSTDKPSNIYLVQIGDEHVKVGLSNKPKARWKRIKYESGLEITPIKTWEGKACELFDIEHECHYSSGIERDNSLGTHFNGWKEVYHISQKDKLLKFLEARLE